MDEFVPPHFRGPRVRSIEASCYCSEQNVLFRFHLLTRSMDDAIAVHNLTVIADFVALEDNVSFAENIRQYRNTRL